MAGNQPPAVTPTRTKRESRSRKGCPECRSRKIKCDEQKPECGQCLKTGRSCQILDSLFKPHSYSFMVSPAKNSSSAEGQTSAGQGNGPDARSRDSASQKDPTNPTEEANTLEWPISSPNRDNSPVTTIASSTNIHQGRKEDSTVDSATMRDHPKRPFAAVSSSEHLYSPAVPHESPYSIPTAHEEDSYQDRCEIAFFLRHFSEGPGQWMDICGGKSYFSQNAVVLAHWSPLVRYAACALGAKQLGQTRHPESQIRQTKTQSLMMKALIDTRLGFTWYGAKYYEKAIKLLANHISNKDQSYSLSPNYVYGLGLTPQSGDYGSTREQDEDEFPYLILAACILCQYEDVNSTIRAWSGHLDGIFRLLRPHLTEPGCFEVASRIPQPVRALDAVFWFVVINDMLDACMLRYHLRLTVLTMNLVVTRSKTRIDPDDISVWRNMGLPLDGDGHFKAELPGEAQLEIILFKALVRMMCQLMNSEPGDITQWTRMNEEFDRWQNAVPPSFYIPIAWPPVEPNPSPITDPFTRELWFASDICATTLAFYHMARMILLANCPVNLFRQTRDGNDVLGTYNSLQKDLRKHAMEIIPIMHAMPSETVQKYMLQPLYVAGRSLTDNEERRSLLHILRDMGDNFGLFTDYRIEDLCEEWGMPYSGIDRRDGHGILT